jgi:hypothetical protein
MQIFKCFNKSNKFSRNILTRLFCENFPKTKFQEVHGILKPAIKSSKPNFPKNELFYGVPLSKEIPKSKEDLIRKMEYINSYDDMIELFNTSRKHFSGREMGAFLERLQM